jgi:hypothetical protein
MNYITDMLLKRNIQTRKWDPEKKGNTREKIQRGGYNQKKKKIIFWEYVSTELEKNRKEFTKW